MCTRNDTYLNTLTTSTTEKRTMNAGYVCESKEFPEDHRQTLWRGVEFPRVQLQTNRRKSLNMFIENPSITHH